MNTTHKNECRGGARQVVKSLYSNATNFIAKCLHPQGFLMCLLTEWMHLAALFLCVYGALSLLEVACKAR
jgi:hypothetical protein